MTPWEQVIDETRETYNGPLIVGEDLMQFHIGENEPTILLRGAEWPR